MTKYQSLFIYGAFIIFTGILLIVFHQQFTFPIQYTVATVMILSAIFALVTSLKNKNKAVRFRYHELHAFSMLVYSVLLLPGICDSEAIS